MAAETQSYAFKFFFFFFFFFGGGGDSHGVVLVKTFPLMFQLLLYD